MLGKQVKFQLSTVGFPASAINASVPANTTSPSPLAVLFDPSLYIHNLEKELKPLQNYEASYLPPSSHIVNHEYHS